jgi:hypothetical protein
MKAEKASAMTTFERHLQTGIQLILVGVVVWVGTSILELRQDMVLLKERDESKTKTFENLRNEVARSNESRYRVEDARRDFQRIEVDMKAIEVKVETLSRMREESALFARTLSNQVDELTRRINSANGVRR